MSTGFKVHDTRFMRHLKRKCLWRIHCTYGLHDELQLPGDYRGMVCERIVRKNPEYLAWLIDMIPWFRISLDLKWVLERKLKRSVKDQRFIRGIGKQGF